MNSMPNKAVVMKRFHGFFFFNLEGLSKYHVDLLSRNTEETRAGKLDKDREVFYVREWSLFQDSQSRQRNSGDEGRYVRFYNGSPGKL